MSANKTTLSSKEIVGKACLWPSHCQKGISSLHNDCTFNKVVQLSIPSIALCCFYDSFMALAKILFYVF